MQCRFDFFARRESAGFARTEFRNGRLTAVATDHDIDREGYARPAFEAFTATVSSVCEDVESDLSFRGLSIRRGKGCRASSERSAALLTTVCDLDPEQSPVFLAQFDRALNYIEGKSGFAGSALFYSAGIEGGKDRFINIARWRTVDHFLSVFASQGFREVVSGNFRFSSQVMISDISLLMH